MTSSYLERSRSWLQYVSGLISRKQLEIESRLQWSSYRKCYMKYQMVTRPLTSRDRKRSRSWPHMFEAHYLENGWRYRFSYDGAPIGYLYGYQVVMCSMTLRDLASIKIIMQVLTIHGRGNVRVKNVNSHPFICLSIPVNYNKTANTLCPKKRKPPNFGQ